MATTPPDDDSFLQDLIEHICKAIEDPGTPFLSTVFTVETDWGHGITSSITYDLGGSLDPSPSES